jgi:hypothetical protein
MPTALEPDPGPDGGSEGDGTAVPTHGAAAAVPAARLWTWAVASALGAALAAWLVGEWLLVVYHDALNPRAGPFPPPSVKLGMIKAQSDVATLTFTAYGALLGLTLGVAGGAARRLVAAAGRAGLAGLVLGGGVGGGAAASLGRIYFAHQDPLDDSLLLPLLTHVGIAAAAGGAAGWVLGLGLGGSVGRTIGGGVLGAAGGACLYELVGALVFPNARTGDPVSAAPVTRMFFLLAVSLLTAAGAVWVARSAAPGSRSGGKPAPLPE